MSLVGTRPPTVDEWEKYEMHHRSRLAFKPGLTGMWQVSGRSNITDFEEVVRLDTEYIKKWSPGLDIEGGLSFQHGFSTVVAAKHIGKNCRIFQQVTIGFNGAEQPILEDRVEVSAGAIVIGKVCLHSDCVVGAGSVVVKDVPENTVVVGVPAKIIRLNKECVD